VTNSSIAYRLIDPLLQLTYTPQLSIAVAVFRLEIAKCCLKAAILDYLGDLGLVERIIETAPTSEGEGCFDRWTVTSSAIEFEDKI
jgi:hypothetical protein